MAGVVTRLSATALCFGAIGFIGAGVAQNRSGQRIELVATKYAFNPPEVRIKRGHPVTFVLNATDFPHGFSVPDFQARADLIPGKTLSITITPDRTGKFPFLCDNFCGEGHDRMSGFLVVED